MLILRNVGAVLAGLLLGGLANMALVLANTVFFPMPAGLDMADTAGMSAWLRTLPQTAFLLPMAAHLVQAGLGAWVAARLAGSRPMALALVVGTLSLLAGVANAVQMPLPTWMYAEFPLYLAAAWGGGRLARRHDAPTR